MQGWHVSPLVLAAAALGGYLFARAFVRLRRRGRADHAGTWRAVLFGTGLAVSTLPLLSPLADTTAAGHMLEHVLLGDAGPALLLLALRGPLLVFVVPAALLRTVARSARLRAGAGALARPSAAIAVWAAVYTVWHVPAVYDLAVANGVAHAAEHASFAAAGFLAWTVLVDPTRRGRVSTSGRLAVAGAIFALGQTLAGVLLLAPEPLYASYPDLGDQQLAAVVM